MEDDLTDAFGTLLLGNIDLNNLVLRLEIVELHLVIDSPGSHDLTVAHLELQRGYLIYSLPLHCCYALIGIIFKTVANVVVAINSRFVFIKADALAAYSCR